MLPQPFSAYLPPILLLAASNIFMATAWYWHLRFKEVALCRVISGQTIVKRSLSQGAHDTGLRPDIVSGDQIAFEFTRRDGMSLRQVNTFLAIAMNEGQCANQYAQRLDVHRYAMSRCSRTCRP